MTMISAVMMMMMMMMIMIIVVIMVTKELLNVDLSLKKKGAFLWVLFREI